MDIEAKIQLIDKAIDAGQRDSREIGDVFDDLDLALEIDGKGAVLRYFFDCWSDAINHDYMVYQNRDPNEWISAAKELRSWYQGSTLELSARTLWNETIPKNA
ncbi:hypothetical protein ACNKU7_18690 [Microbulbifer sp. SA54]|uniref:hypothetical protein n=1 Tax=Microbulbifer sp. SA54 TaxID=3401577 RepID=UPI003AADF79D